MDAAEQEFGHHMKPTALHILLVDDSDDDNFFSQLAIKKSGIPASVSVCVDGLDALHYLTGKGVYEGKEVTVPDVIFLDINMPKMNGWEFLNDFSKLDIAQNPTIVIVMLSTSDHTHDINKAEEISVVKSYLTKPLSEKHLVQIATEHCGYSDGV